MLFRKRMLGEMDNLISKRTYYKIWPIYSFIFNCYDINMRHVNISITIANGCLCFKTQAHIFSVMMDLYIHYAPFCAFP